MNRNLNERIDVQKKFDEASATVTYIGEAEPGASATLAVWRIYKFTTTGSIKDKQWASGTTDYNKIWNDRVSYTYS